MNEETIFVYSSGKLVAEYSTKPPPQNPTTQFTITDQLGSPRVLVNTLGEVVSRRDFMPFGEEIVPDSANLRTNSALKYNGDGVRQKFTGYQKDSETGLDFAEARMYENRHARFTAVDPLLASGKSTNPQTFNRYVYVMNNPIRFSDPMGLQAAERVQNVYPCSRGSACDYSVIGGKTLRVNTRNLDTDTVTAEPSIVTTTSSIFNLELRARSVGDASSNNEAVRSLLNGFRHRIDEIHDGSEKGAANAAINFANGGIDIAYSQTGLNLFFNTPQIEKYEYSSLAGVRFGTAIETAAVVGPMFAGGVFSGGSSLSVVPETQVFRFSQNTASTTFSLEGTFNGRSVLNVAGDLRSGALSPSQVPVGYVQRGRINLIDNTRSSIALQEAGVPMNQWNLVNGTGISSFENSVTTKLANNGLTNTGTNTVRMGGCRYFCPSQ